MGCPEGHDATFSCSKWVQGVLVVRWSAIFCITLRTSDAPAGELRRAAHRAAVRRAQGDELLRGMLSVWKVIVIGLIELDVQIEFIQDFGVDA
jgi:hypothetical protein